MPPAPLALRVGEDFPVVDLYRRRLLKCTACGSRNATIRVYDPHAPFYAGLARAAQLTFARRQR